MRFMIMFLSGFLLLAISAATIEQSTTDPGNSIATVSRIMTYQGILKNDVGDPVPDSTYNLTFRLYSASSGGYALWASPTVQVNTTGGYFNAEFGPINLPFDMTYYLSIQVGADPEMTARQKLTSTAYAARCDSTEFAINIADNSVTSSKITNGTIQFSDIGQNGATTGQVMKWSGSAWIVGNDSVGSGGDSKWAFRITDTADTTLISGEKWGLARNGNMLYGNADSTHVNLGVACTTGVSGQNNKYCVVGGGINNTASGAYATVSGGQSNSASDTYAMVGGGGNNTASDYCTTVAGGGGNTASSGFATVAGGNINTASGGYASIGGGSYNTSSGFGATISGGLNNTASSVYATISGGLENMAAGDFSVIIGGTRDTLMLDGDYSMIFGRSVYLNSPYRVAFFDSVYNGRLGINRDDHNGGINYPIHVGGNPANGNGAYLTAGGVWTNGSSRTFKENFVPYNGAELLSKIANLSLTSYNYINSNEKHFGPVAEEFVGAFDTGVIRELDGKRDDLYLSSGDVAGVALAGVKELLKKIEVLEKRVAELEARQEGK